jgi:hypothetical protein
MAVSMQRHTQAQLQKVLDQHLDALLAISGVEAIDIETIGNFGTRRLGLAVKVSRPDTAELRDRLKEVLGDFTNFQVKRAVARRD